MSPPAQSKIAPSYRAQLSELTVCLNMRSSAASSSASIILKIAPVLAQGLLKVLEKLEIGAESLTFLYAMTTGNVEMFSVARAVCCGRDRY